MIKLYEYVPRPSPYGVYNLQPIRFIDCILMSVISTIEAFLAARVQNQSYQYHKLLKALSKFYRIHSELIVKYNVGLKTPLQQGISKPVIKGDLVYKLKE